MWTVSQVEQENLTQQKRGGYDIVWWCIALGFTAGVKWYVEDAGVIGSESESDITK